MRTRPDFCTSTDPGRLGVSPLAGCSRATHGSENADVFGVSCPSRACLKVLSIIFLVAFPCKEETRILDNFTCVRELQCSQTRRRVFHTQLPEVSRPTFLTISGLFSSRLQRNSPSILFVRSRCAEGCQTNFPISDSQTSLKICLVQLLLRNSILGISFDLDD